MVLERPADAWSERDGPCKSIVVDFASVPLTWENGPIRFVKGSANSRETIPALAEESLASKTATVCPAPAGSVSPPPAPFMRTALGGLSTRRVRTQDRGVSRPAYSPRRCFTPPIP